MLKLSKEELNRIEFQLYNKARDIDVAIYNALFDDLGKEFVLDSLMLYLTKEGGIGGGLHIDSYNPNASVYQTFEALRILSAVGFDANEKNPIYVELIQKIGNYLFNRCETKNGLWNPLSKTNDAFAHSEEFNYMDNPFAIWGCHPTQAILGFILELMPSNKAYYKKALKQMEFIERYVDEQAWTSYDVLGFSYLLGSLKRTNLFSALRLKIEEKILEVIQKGSLPNLNIPLCLLNVSVEKDLKDLVDKSLDSILSSRASHGLWEHKAGWGSTRYPEADSAQLKWIGAETVWNLYLLKSYGRIEE